MRAWAQAALEFIGIAVKAQHDHALEPFDRRSGACAPEVGEWVLIH